MKYFDLNKKEIQNDDTVLFSHEDSQEPSGFNRRVSNVKLCFWSEIERRYIPFSEVYSNPNIKDVEVITNSVELKS